MTALKIRLLIKNLSITIPFALLASCSCQFEQSGCSHAATNTHGDDGIFHRATLSLDHRVPDEPAAGHPKRMARRNRATIDIEGFRRDAEPIPSIERLRRESLVELPEADIGNRQSTRTQQLGNGEDRTYAHFIRLAAGNGHAAV
jgi:hypothetical protein